LLWSCSKNELNVDEKEETLDPVLAESFDLSSPILSGLNAYQIGAVTSGPGVIMVYAGPGSGKTKVICHRVGYLVEYMGIRPDTIILVTFTKKASVEMSERVKHLIGEDKAAKVVMGTFHATCAQFLKKHGARVGLQPSFLICDPTDCKALIKRVLVDLAGTEPPLDVDASHILSLISGIKNKMQSVKKFHWDPKSSKLTVSVLSKESWQLGRKSLQKKCPSPSSPNSSLFSAITRSS